MKKLIALLPLYLSFLSPLCAHAQNPIIKGQYTADPTAKVFGDRLYLYSSHDIISPVEPEKKWFSMADYHVFSTSNLTDWTDHGVILDQTQVPWGDPKGYSMWAPDCVEHNGKYYFVFPDGINGHHGFGVGVAIADSPIGPFVPQQEAIKGVMGIDPCVLQCPDGRNYLVWAGRGITMGLLSDDLLSLKGDPWQVKGLPEGFKEGPFAFYRDGWYYMTFPWVRHEGGTECLAYAMSRKPEGPYTLKGILMDEWENKCWTNHHSIVQFKGQWYLFYHHNDYSPSFDKNRSVCIDSLSFHKDGTIEKVIPTLRGVGIVDARKLIEVDRYSSISPKNATVEYIDSLQPFLGWALHLNAGGWSTFNRVDISGLNSAANGKNWLQVRYMSPTKSELVLKLVNIQIAKLDLPAQDSFTVVRLPINIPSSAFRSPHSVLCNLKLQLVKGKDVAIDWISFDKEGLVPWTTGARKTGQYRNYFAELGYPADEIRAKVNGAFNDLFFGKDKVYFEVGDTMAYVSDLKNHDVRTEGMSYGMMAAVQMNRQDIFDRLWRWTKTYMPVKSGPAKGYFAWSCKTDGTHNAEGPASDGELYFVTSLLLASQRWTPDTGIDYKAEARRILDNAFSKPVTERGDQSFIDRKHHIINFVPGAPFTDPSYSIPVFYEIWADLADDGQADFYRECARASREYLRRSIHPLTGLNPDNNNFDGSLLDFKTPRGHFRNTDFRYDSWRVPLNIAIDYSWSCAEPQWQQQYANTIQVFFFNEGIDHFVDQYRYDGMPAEHPLRGGDKPGLRHSVGLVGTTAAISLAASHGKAADFVERLWTSANRPFADGYFDAYFDGFERFFSLLLLSGNYKGNF